MPRPDTVRAPAPFRHPHWESPRARQFRAPADDVAAFIAMCDARRARIARTRVLERVI